MQIWEKRRDEIRWAQALNLANELVAAKLATGAVLNDDKLREALDYYREIAYEMLCEPSPAERDDEDSAIDRWRGEREKVDDQTDHIHTDNPHPIQ